MNIKNRIAKLRSLMKERGITVYVIPTSDYHDSEYISDYFKSREYMSGFTGSAGTMIVTEREAVLYTDGRYFIQAEKELDGSEIALMKMGEKDTISQKEYILGHLENGKLGFDGKTMSSTFVQQFENVELHTFEDLISVIWDNRPHIHSEKVDILDEVYAGEAASDKLERLRNKMQEQAVDTHILTSLDDIAWLFNIRGNDVAYNPVVLSYAIIEKNLGTIYLNATAVTEEISEYFKNINFRIKEYNDFYNDVKRIKGKVLLDRSKVNYEVICSLKEALILDMENPTVLMKAIKNPIEIANLKKAHLMDGVAVTKFMYWLKNSVREGKLVTEISAADKLEEFRKENASYIEPSFNTISAYEANGAMMHYSADANSNAQILKKGFLLVDSGGQYLEGTTDITRTFAMGELSEEAKMHFTLVTRGMLRLANTRFLYGCKGINLDILAREGLWNIGMDYKCGTGHGVGYFLNVHEAPNGFRWKSVPQRSDGCVLEPGMVTTDEPGVYLEGRYGIRIENELLCVERDTNEYGTFLEFEQLTLAPIDLDAINVEYLDKSDIMNLNNYHQMVYNTIAEFLNEEERVWLKEYTGLL